MSLTINATTPPQPVEPRESAKASDTKAQASPAVADSVQISSAALTAAKAAAQEATETAAQTAREANAGDHQAQRLLAREQATKQ